MAKKKKSTYSQQSLADNAASFILDNLYRYNDIAIEDRGITPWDLRDALIRKNPGNLYEVKNTDNGDVLFINGNDCAIYAGDAAFSDAGQKGFKIDDIIYDRSNSSWPEKKKDNSSSGILILTLLIIIALIAISIFT